MKTFFLTSKTDKILFKLWVENVKGKPQEKPFSLDFFEEINFSTFLEVLYQNGERDSRRRKKRDIVKRKSSFFCCFPKRKKNRKSCIIRYFYCVIIKQHQKKVSFSLLVVNIKNDIFMLWECRFLFTIFSNAKGPEKEKPKVMNMEH